MNENVPIYTSGDKFRLAQTCFYGVDPSDFSGSASNFQSLAEPPNGYSSNRENDFGEGQIMENEGDSITFFFSTEYTIPASDFDIIWRRGNFNESVTVPPEIEFEVNGTTAFRGDFAIEDSDILWRIFDPPTDDLSPGSYTVSAEVIEDHPTDYATHKRSRNITPDEDTVSVQTDNINTGDVTGQEEVIVYDDDKSRLGSADCNTSDFENINIGSNNSVSYVQFAGIGETRERGNEIEGGTLDSGANGNGSNRVGLLDFVAGRTRLFVDALGGRDARFDYNDDDTVDANHNMDGPEHFPPNGIFFEGQEELADTNITTARLNTQFNDHTSGNSLLQLSFDGGETYLPIDGSEQNTESVEVNASTTGLSVQARGQFSAFPLDSNDGTAQNASPKFGYNGHEIDSWTIDVDTDSIEILFDEEFNDNRLATISNLADSSNQLFRWEGDVCRIFRQGEERTEVDLKEENITSTTDIEDTYSSVQVIGRNGIRSPVIESDNAPPYVNRHKEIRDRDIESEQDARRRALEFIADNGEIIYEGDIDTLPTRAPLGEEMDGEIFSHGKDMFIERVNYSKRSSSISLGRRRDFGQEVLQLERSKRSSDILDTT